MGSDLWFAEFERLLNKYEAQGLSFDAAEARAANEAEGAMLDRLADHADNMRKHAKENR